MGRIARRKTLFGLLIIVFLTLVAALIRPDLAVDGLARLAQFVPDRVRRIVAPPPDPLAERMAERGFSLGQAAYVRIFKQEAKLEVWLKAATGYQLYQTYPICRFSGRLGPKLKEGDRQAPEGFYAVGRKQLNPNSRHHLSFNLGYPNAYDQAHGRTGTYLMVHGGCSSIGCYAMTDQAIDDIYRIVEAALQDGMDHVPVHVFPFRMTAERVAAAANQSWIGFWRNLKTGYDFFEAVRKPPAVFACGKAYGFQPGNNCQLIAGW